MRRFATHSCRVRRERWRQVLCRHYRFPPGRSGKQLDVRIGVYGRGAGKWTLLAARKEWERIRDWSGESGRDQGKQGQERTKDPSGLDDAIQGFLSTKTSLNEFTLTNYRRQLENQVRGAFQGRHHFANWNGTTVAGRKSEHSAPISRTEVVTTRHFGCRRSWHRHWTTRFLKGGCDATRATKQRGRQARPQTPSHISGNRCQNCWRQSN